MERANAAMLPLDRIEKLALTHALRQTLRQKTTKESPASGSALGQGPI
jgi:hypothetical protein